MPIRAEFKLKVRFGLTRFRGSCSLRACLRIPPNVGADVRRLKSKSEIRNPKSEIRNRNRQPPYVGSYNFKTGSERNESSFVNTDSHDRTPWRERLDTATG